MNSELVTRLNNAATVLTSKTASKFAKNHAKNMILRAKISDAEKSMLLKGYKICTEGK